MNRQLNNFNENTKKHTKKATKRYSDKKISHQSIVHKIDIRSVKVFPLETILNYLKVYFNRLFRFIISIGKILVSYIKSKNPKQLALACSVFILVLVTMISFSMASLTPVKSVEIFSNNLSYTNGEEGAWKVTKSSEWIGSGKAEINFNIDSILMPIVRTMDVLLVLDNSESMVEDRLNSMKNSANDLVDKLLSYDSTNQVALVTYNSNSTVLSNFTSDKSVLQTQINSIVATGGTSHYQAMKGIEEVLSNYTYEEGSNFLVLFLTDGYSTVNSANEASMYQYLMDLYPYIRINSIFYEMGDINEESYLATISENKFIANVDNLNGVFYKATVGSIPYTSFVIEDTINTEFFDINNNEKIEASVGNASIVEEGNTKKVVWTLGEGQYYSGTNEKVKIYIDLADDQLDVANAFQTNTQEHITSLILESSEDVTSSLTPVISNSYSVIYDANAPSTCTVSAVPDASANFVYSSVEISDMKPTCDGYLFKGWKILNNNVTKTGTNTFLMPEEDVTIKAEWARLDVKVSMSGKLYKVTNLYEMMASNSVSDGTSSTYVTSDTGIDFSSDPSDTNGKGIYQLSATADDQYPVYYYRGAVDNNNAKLGGFCWKIVRTTSTGGVKMIYNGAPDSNGECTGSTPTIGNSKFNDTNNSVTDVGYMYDAKYPSSSKTMNYTWYGMNGKSSYSKSTSWYNLLGIYGTNSSVPAGACLTGWYFSSSISYNSSTGVYSLVSASRKKAPQLTGSLTGYYTCFSTSATSCSKVGYVVYSPTSGNLKCSGYGTIGYAGLTDGRTVSSGVEEAKQLTWLMGTGVSYDETTGSYTLVNTTTTQPYYWSQNVSDLYDNSYKYTCLTDGDSCSSVYYIINKSSSPTYVTFTGGENYEDMYAKALESKYVYGNDVVYNDDGTYTLVDTITSPWILWSDDKAAISNNYHYTCYTDGDTCETVYYNYNVDGNVIYYFGLSGGKMLSDVVSTDNDVVNVNDSTIKGVIDTWYSTNMTDITKFLEDTVYCNDRSYTEDTWNKDANSSSSALTFGPSTRASSPSTVCPRMIDSFTVDASNGNGKLTYPVGLLTSDELRMAGTSSSSYLYSSTNYWTMSPYKFSVGSSSLYYSSALSNVNSSNSYGVRPVITLLPGTRALAGTGTSSDPYTVGAFSGIRVVGDGTVVANYTRAIPNTVVTLSSKVANKLISSFKLNGETITGDSFTMPEEDVIITDIVTLDGVIIESEHNPYPNGMTTAKVYGEAKFEGATSLNVELTYQTESTSYDWIYLYASPTSTTPLGNTKYGGTTKTTKTITVSGDYVKITFRTDNSGNNYYGFKAVITPNYS